LPTAGNPKGALARARINFFVDTWSTKAGSYWFKILTAEGEERENLAQEFVEVVGKELDPLLKDAAPFFGGSSKVTLAEALTAPFLVRLYGFAKYGHMPQSMIDGLNALPNFSKWAAEVVKQESVLYIWDEEKTIAQTKAKLDSMKNKAK
jgi:glutathione S-transferase